MGTGAARATPYYSLTFHKRASMDLLIVRHAIAFERNQRRWRDDGDRPLSPEGMVRARKAAAGLKQITERPQCVLTSPLIRAKQTATILAEFAGWPKAVECAALAPDESPDEVFAALATQKEKIVAVVGHQPGLGRLLAACLPAQVRGGVNPEAFELKKMGAALVSFPRAARAGTGALQWLVPPRILRAAK
jgi:phosphohistidine phosphatase